MKARTGKAVSVPAGLGLSLITNIIITATGISGIAAMLNKQTITWESTGYWIMAMLLTASFAGGKTAIAAIKTQRYLVSLMSGLLYWMLLLCITALLWGGNFSSVLETGALILSGSITAALLHLPHKNYSSRKRRRSYC